MSLADLQSLCAEGQQQLMLMDYLAAETTLLRAEQLALHLNDFDTLSRLYMPLQEARRQRRQRCGEGNINLRLLAGGPDDPAIDANRLIDAYPQGQLLIAGWGTLEPARAFRKLQQERGLYVETFLAAVYPSESPGGPRVIVVVPVDDGVDLPAPSSRSLPPNSIALLEDALPSPRVGDAQTYAWTMSLWERLHAPALAVAEAEVDLLQKMNRYREVIAIDYACELAHQGLSAAARTYSRHVRASENRQ